MVWRQGRKATFQTRSPFRQSTVPDGRLRSVGGDLRRGLESHCTLCQHTSTQYVNLFTFCFAQRKHVKRKLDIVLKWWKVIKLISWFFVVHVSKSRMELIVSSTFFSRKVWKAFSTWTFKSDWLLTSGGIWLADRNSGTARRRKLSAAIRFLLQRRIGSQKTVKVFIIWNVGFELRYRYCRKDLRSFIRCVFF